VPAQVEEEIRSLTSGPALTRRGFVAGSLAGGFAAAVAPTGALLAQTIHTDETGLDTGDARVAAADGASLPVYWARPRGGSGLASVLVVQEIFGVHEHLRDVCRRFAKAGYLAVAPELYFRQGDPSKYTSIPELFQNVVSKVPDAQVLGDLDACAAWAAQNGGDRAKLGITGFCWGGRIVWLYSAHSDALKAGVAWYGRLTSASTAATPSHPYDVAARLHAPVLGLYGGQDNGIPVATVDDMKKRLAAGGPASRASEFVVYPDAPHAFHADYRPSYRKEAAADGWKRCLDWFARHGVA